MTRADPGVTVEFRSDHALATMSVRRNRLPALERGVREVFGLELPHAPQCVTAGPVSFLWAGAGQWLATSDGDNGTAFERRLRDALGNLASVTDQSDGRIILRVTGPRVRDALAKGVPTDLHPRVFRPGDAAITTVATIGVHLWQVDEAPTYELIVPRSFAVAFREWFDEAAAEFGIGEI